MAYHQLLNKVGIYVLEEWAMMMVECSSESSQDFDQFKPLYVASASYKGVFDGTLTVQCQAAFVETLARNVLGLDSDSHLDESEILDSLRELVNVLSGNLLTEAFGEETVFDLPELRVGQLPASKVPACVFDNEVVLLGDGLPVHLRLEIISS